MDGIELEILWSNLISAASEQAQALRRIAFSPVVREAGDLACALLDRKGRMIAQAVTGTPGHINTLAAAGKHFVDKFPPDSLVEGDILITNDPWLSAGHFFDISVITPVFRKGKVIAFFGSTIHHTDIGGYGVGAGARDVHEEGLWIPRAKLYEAGKPNELLFDMIRHNVRTPDEVLGDLAAQVSSGRVGVERLQLLCDRHNLDDIEQLAEEIITRSETATRESIRKLESGTYHGESRFDIPGGQEILLKCALIINADEGSVHIDFTGSSGASPHGVNVVLNYTHAYSTFALRSTLDPDLPNNYGSLKPITVSAPDGCIVNAKYPSPVAARHVVGMYVPMPILKALYQVTPGQVLAEGAGAVWTFQIQGKDEQGDPFTSAMFNYSGGMGARREKPGLGATCYPTGVAAVPVEVLEAAMPIEFTQKELIDGSGGEGATKGGDGQVIAFHLRTEEDWLLNAVPSRVKIGAEGLDGGEHGKAGRFMINGKDAAQANKIVMRPDDKVLLETPGGGGYGKMK
ncbi:MAG: Acetophenone carboxylase delta subunit [Alphaproteobacteria bacterium MarineAlpha11_Bin1]|nr:MAG: Acetophenone carboxylase delta subunit [Alphaproteobacteria bacterium MarineAlpha11_Bin1]